SATGDQRLTSRLFSSTVSVHGRSLTDPAAFEVSDPIDSAVKSSAPTTKMMSVQRSGRFRSSISCRWVIGLLLAGELQTRVTTRDMSVTKKQLSETYCATAQGDRAG